MEKNEFINNRHFRKHHFKPKTGLGGISIEELIEKVNRASEEIQRQSRQGTGSWVIYTGIEGATHFNNLDLDVYGPGSNPNYFDTLSTTDTSIEVLSLWSTL